MATYPKGNKFITKFMVDGKRHTKMHDTQADGEAWELTARAALKLGKPIPDAAPVRVGGKDSNTLGGVLRSAEKLHWSKLRASEKQMGNARIFVKWAGSQLTPAQAFTQAKVREFCEYLTDERKVANSTMNRYMSALSVLINHADLDKRPTLPWYKEGNGRVRFFSPEEEQAVIALLTQWGKERERDLFIFLNDTGLRPWAECAAAEWKQVRNGKLCDIFGKNDTYRDVPLTRRAQVILDRCPRDLPGPFADMNKFTLNDLWERVRTKMPQLHDTVWYTCRHTFASRLVMGGRALKAVAVLMGNSAMIVDKTYAHLAPDYLANAVDALEEYGQGTKLSLVKNDVTG